MSLWRRRERQRGCSPWAELSVLARGPGRKGGSTQCQVGSNRVGGNMQSQDFIKHLAVIGKTHEILSIWVYCNASCWSLQRFKSSYMARAIEVFSFQVILFRGSDARGHSQPSLSYLEFVFPVQGKGGVTEDHKEITTGNKELVNKESRVQNR